MIYLAIIVLIASSGISRLWLLQRRTRTSLSVIDGFKKSLERLSENSSLVAPAGDGSRGAHPVSSLDPARRAALLRIEARRSAGARVAG